MWVYVCILFLSACLYFNANAYMCLYKLCNSTHTGMCAYILQSVDVHTRSVHSARVHVYVDTLCAHR